MSTVLVVDDDPLIADLVVYKLTQAGHQTHTAPDGETGIRLAHQIRPDLMVVDWMMPSMTGIEFCRRIRHSDLADLAGRPIILLTAKMGNAEIAAGLEAGATAYVAKPFNPKDLVQRVSQLLGSAP